MHTNANIPSAHTSPEGIDGQLLNEAVRRASLQSSPVNLTSGLNNFSLSGNPLDTTQEPPTYTIKVQNSPPDISLREAYCLFALAKDFMGLELFPDSNNAPVILARFKSLSAASTCSQALESNLVFGPTFPFYLKAEITEAAFPSSLNLSASSKRPSVGTQRSRFLFSDSFNEAIAESPDGSNGVGKSLLLMEAQQDARDYEQLVRDPWAQQHAQPRSQPGSSASLNAAPASAYGAPQPQTPAADWDRRRQSSVFFNGQSPLLSTQVPPIQVPNLPSLNQSTGQLPSSSQPLPPGLTQQQLSMPPLSAPTSQAQAQAQTPQASSSQNSQVDLSLLARVPPPANPADQNPPCNTLYVGNLPPDATETELRELFAPQRGFRRLSFRTKQPNGSAGSAATNHAHGPMCFVEFDDIAFATKALAELYGRTLSRPGGVPGKGGIRLSFSKNPLGVRGPGQRRTSAFTYQTGFKN